MAMTTLRRRVHQGRRSVRRAADWTPLIGGSGRSAISSCCRTDGTTTRRTRRHCTTNCSATSTSCSSFAIAGGAGDASARSPSRLRGRTFAAVRIFWPSKKFTDAELIPGGGAAQRAGRAREHRRRSRTAGRTQRGSASDLAIQPGSGSSCGDGARKGAAPPTGDGRGAEGVRNPAAPACSIRRWRRRTTRRPASSPPPRKPSSLMRRAPVVAPAGTGSGGGAGVTPEELPALAIS